jgi:hypothetical protein
VDHLLGQLTKAVVAAPAEFLQSGVGEFGAVCAEETAFRMFDGKLAGILTDQEPATSQSHQTTDQYTYPRLVHSTLQQRDRAVLMTV